MKEANADRLQPSHHQQRFNDHTSSGMWCRDTAFQTAHRPWGKRGKKASRWTLVDAIPYHAMPLSHKHMTNAVLIIFYELGCAGGSVWLEGRGERWAAGGPPLHRGEGCVVKVSSGTSLGPRTFDLRTAITPASKWARSRLWNRLQTCTWTHSHTHELYRIGAMCSSQQ